jgi:hypothetical protein
VTKTIRTGKKLIQNRSKENIFSNTKKAHIPVGLIGHKQQAVKFKVVT